MVAILISQLTRSLLQQKIRNKRKVKEGKIKLVIVYIGIHNWIQDSSSSSSSESSSDSDDETKQNGKKAEPAKKTESKTPEKKTDNKTPTKKTFASSSSSSDSDSEEDAKPAKKTKTPEKKPESAKTESAKKKKLESSSSSSSSSDSEDEKPKTPAKGESSKKRKREDSEDEHNAKKQKTDSQPTTPKTPFKRIDPGKVRIEGQDRRLFDNSYLAKGGEDYGLKADKDLRNLHGDRFRHEKTKKKKGSYKGGQLSMTVNSVMFTASSSEESDD